MLEIDNKIIDADELLERVRKNILNKQIKAPVSECRKQTVLMDSDNLDRLMDEYRRTMYQISELKEIKDPEIVSFKKSFSGVRIFIKRVIRKLTFWTIKPYWEQQNMYNATVLEALKRLDEIHAELVSNSEK